MGEYSCPYYCQCKRYDMGNWKILVNGEENRPEWIVVDGQVQMWPWTHEQWAARDWKLTQAPTNNLATNELKPELVPLRRKAGDDERRLTSEEGDELFAGIPRNLAGGGGAKYVGYDTCVEDGILLGR